MATTTTVPPEHVVDVLCRSEYGRAMWRAAQYEALSEILAARVNDLEAQKAPAAEPQQEPAGG